LIKMILVNFSLNPVDARIKQISEIRALISLTCLEWIWLKTLKTTVICLSKAIGGAIHGNGFRRDFIRSLPAAQLPGNLQIPV